MPLTENEALERARAYLKRISRELAYPVADAPSRIRRSDGAEPPHIQLEDGPVGPDFWAFEFPWRATARIMVSPHACPLSFSHGHRHHLNRRLGLNFVTRGNP
jgi:hypothetical protein